MKLDRRPGLSACGIHVCPHWSKSASGPLWWWFPATSEATWTLTFYFLLWRWQFSVSGWWHCIPSVHKTFLLHSLLSAARSCLLRLSGFPNTFNLDAESILPAWAQALALRRPDCPRGGSLWLLARRNSVPLFSLLPKSDVMGSSLGSLNFYFLIFSIQQGSLIPGVLGTKKWIKYGTCPQESAGPGFRFSTEVILSKLVQPFVLRSPPL